MVALLMEAWYVEGMPEIVPLAEAVAEVVSVVQEST
jgi:hypothetical protein